MGKTRIGTVNTEVIATTQACQKSEGEPTHFFPRVSSIQLQLQGFLGHSSYETSSLKLKAVAVTLWESLQAERCAARLAT